VPAGKTTDGRALLIFEQRIDQRRTGEQTNHDGCDLQHC
jgi:hypothetical protein